MQKTKSPLLVIFFTIFLDLLGFGLVIPLLPFFASELGASGFQVGILMTAYSGMQFLFAPFWGRLSDRIGRRPVLLVSIAGNVVAMVLFAFSTNLVVFFLARAFAGMANANIGTAQAYIADVTPPEQRAKGMGLIGAAFGLGFVLGPAFGGILATWHFGAPALVAAALSAVNFAMAWFNLPESLPPEARAKAAARRASRLQTFKESLSHPFLPLLFLLFFLVTVGFAQLETTFALFTEKRFAYGARENGYLFAYIGVVLALVQGGVIRPLRKHVGEAALLLSGVALLTLGLLLLARVETVTGLIVACTVLAFGNGMQMPALSSLVSKQAAAHDQGRVLGVNQSMGSLARILGPLLGGFAFEYGGSTPSLALGSIHVDFGAWTTPFLAAAGILVIAVVIALRIYLRRDAAQATVAEA